MTSIRTHYLDDEDSARLYRAHPHVGRSPDTYCPTCAKTGEYFWRGQSHICDCEMQLQLYKHYLHAGIADTYQRLNWEDYHGDESALIGVGKYLDRHQQFVGRGFGIVFYGPNGTGKTMLANLALKALIKLRYSAFAAEVKDVVKLYTDGWKSNDDRREFDARVMGSQVLLLDDLGREHQRTNALSEVLFDGILRTRTQYGKSTFITTNMTRPEIKERYGSGADSLLYERSIECILNGDDYRPHVSNREVTEMNAGETRPIT